MEFQSSPLRMSGWKVLLSAILVVQVQVMDASDGNGKILACYYLRSQRVPVSAIPADLCTHIIFASGKINGTGIQPVNSDDVTIYSALVGLKSQNSSLRILLSLNEGFPSVVDSDNETMKVFTKNAISFLREHSFDGVDFDWEFPKAHQKNKFRKFLSIFRGAVTEDGLSNSELSPLLMSMALGNNAHEATKAYHFSAVNKSIDFATVLSFDFHLYSKHDNVTGYNSPLYSTQGEVQTQSVSGIIDFYVDKGLDRSKILMGMPTYGRTWTLANSTNHGLHAPAIGKGPSGPVIHSAGVYITEEVCIINRTKSGGLRDEEAGVPYLYQGTTWLSYDDPESFRLKCGWAVNASLGGLAVYTLTYDDISGTCPGGQFPMTNTLKTCLQN